jgi:DNA-binding transcriptional ArsR family regulator
MAADPVVSWLAARQAVLCRALGNPRRLLIVWLLSGGELSVGDLAARAGSSIQNISQHLRMLRLAGVVACRRAGHTIYYRTAECEFLKGCPAVARAREAPVACLTEPEKESSR